MTIQRAEADLAQARLEAQTFAKKAEEAAARAAKLEIYLEMARVYAAHEANGSSAEQEANAQEAHGSRNKNGNLTISEAAVQILLDVGKRQKTSELLEKLELRGYVVGGSNKAANLASILSKNEKVNSIRTEGWGLILWDESPPVIVPDEELPF